MRTTILTMVLCFSALHIFAQKTEIRHYIFPEFIKGSVLMKSGIKNEAMLNYNALTEEMIFDKNGNKLAIGQLESVDTVYIGSHKFIPQKGRFFEIIYSGKYQLFADHKASIVDPGKPAAYGGTSQTSSVTSYSTFLSNGQAYNLQLPEGVETKANTEYWLKKDGNLTSFLNLRQLSRLFDDKSAQYKSYVKEHKVKYEDPDSLIELTKFMEQN